MDCNIPWSQSDLYHQIYTRISAVYPGAYSVYELARDLSHPESEIFECIRIMCALGDCYCALKSKHSNVYACKPQDRCK